MERVTRGDLGEIMIIRWSGQRPDLKGKFERKRPTGVGGKFGGNVPCERVIPRFHRGSAAFFSPRS